MSCDALPSRLITAWHTLQRIEANPDEPVATYGGGRSLLVPKLVTSLIHNTNDNTTNSNSVQFNGYDAIRYDILFGPLTCLRTKFLVVEKQRHRQLKK